jgi:hypothetical protein
VETGWVAFHWHDVESFIPAGAACRTRPRDGPGVPYFLDASEEFTRAISSFQATEGVADLQTALSAARPRDGLTLWHLLLRIRGEQRSEVLNRLARLVPLPPMVTKGNNFEWGPKAIDAAWNALQLGETDWWRQWKRQW